MRASTAPLQASGADERAAPPCDQQAWQSPCMGDNGSAIWDTHAATFDEEPDHGLRDPSVRSAWASLLASVLPVAPVPVVDLGCGTGSLTTLLAEAGHHVYGLDASSNMLEVARHKAAYHGVAVSLIRGDVSRPPSALGSFDVVLARHVLWAVQDPETTLARWIGLLRPQGRLVLIEGRWATVLDCRRQNAPRWCGVTAGRPSCGSWTRTRFGARRSPTNAIWY